MEKRKELGLDTITVQKRYSVQEEDEEPRYQISQMSELARIDLDATNQMNL